MSIAPWRDPAGDLTRGGTSEDKVNLAAFCHEFKVAAAQRGKDYLLTSAWRFSLGLHHIMRPSKTCAAGEHEQQVIIPMPPIPALLSAVTTAASPNDWKGG